MFDTPNRVHESEDRFNAAVAEIRAETPPRDLQAVCDAVVLQVISAAESGSGRRTVRLAWSAGLAAAVLLVFLVVTPMGNSVVFADMVKALESAQSVTVAGWIRGEEGERVPYRQWVGKDGTVWARFGEPGRQTTVVVTRGRRLIRDAGGTVYRAEAHHGQTLDLDRIMRFIFAGYEYPETWDSHWEASRERMGDTVRFRYREAAMLGAGPGRFRLTWDVDSETGRPHRCEVQQFADGRWWIVSDLQFVDFDAGMVEADLALAGPDGRADPLSAEMQAEHWFALGISGTSLVFPAVLAPAGGGAAQSLDPGQPRFADVTSGGAFRMWGGVTTITMVNQPLSDYVSALTGMTCSSNPFSQRRISMEVSVKSALPWRDKLGPVLEATGLSARRVLRDREMTVFRLSLGDEGFEASDQRFESRAVSADKIGYRFEFSRTPLRTVCQAMLGNSNLTAEVGRNWRVEFDDDPRFDTLVDVTFSHEGQDWRPNLDYLAERFGLNWEKVHLKDKQPVVELFEPDPLGN